jgi:hypothetical protein
MSGESQLDFFSGRRSGENNRQVYLNNKDMGRALLTVRTGTIFLIFLIVYSLAIFSFGFEKGKKTTASSTLISTEKTADPVKTEPLKETTVALAQKEKNKPALIPVPPQIPILREETNKNALDKEHKPSRAFTIQVASYNKTKHAEMAAKELEKKGYTTFIFNSGKYIVLCVGDFNNRHDAQPYLQRLKKLYQSCYIRRL